MNIKLYKETKGQLIVAKSIKKALEDPRKSISFKQAMETLRSKYV